MPTSMLYRLMAAAVLAGGVGCEGSTEGLHDGPAGDDLATSSVDAGPIAVQVLPAAPNVGLRETQLFAASVTGTGDTRVTFGLSGPGCTGAACGSITPMGDSQVLFTGPFCLPSPPLVTLTATSTADPGRTGTATITLSRAPSELSGRYVFLYEGTAGTGVVHVAGTFAVDAQGMLSGGIHDAAHPAGLESAVAFGGSATRGCYRRGSLQLDYAGGGKRVFSWVASESGDRFRFLQMDQSGDRGVGEARRVVGAPLSLAALAGDHAVVLSGSLDVASRRVGLLARFHADSDGRLSAGTLDVNTAGVTSAASPASGAWTLDAATGRIAVTLTASAPASRTLHFVAQPSSPSEAFWVAADPPGASTAALGGHGVRQLSAPYTAASISGPLLLSLVGTNGNENSAAALAALEADGAGHLASGLLDENRDSAITAAAPLSGSYAVDPGGAGRGTLHLAWPSGGSRDLTMVLTGPQSALLLDGTGAASGSQVAVGRLEARSGLPYGSASLDGAYVLGTSTMSTRYTPLQVAVVSVQGGMAVGLGDGSDIFAAHPDVTLFGGAIAIPANGRIAAGSMLIYLSSARRALMLDVNPQQHQPSLAVIDR